MTNEELILNLWDDLQHEVKRSKEAGTSFRSIYAVNKIREPYPKHLLISAKGHITSNRKRCYLIEITGKYMDGVLFHAVTNGLDQNSFERCAGDVLKDLSYYTILSKHPMKIAHRPSRARYRPGERIRSMDELAEQDFVYWGDKITPSGWFMNWNFGMALKAVKGGFIRYAVMK